MTRPCAAFTKIPNGCCAKKHEPNGSRSTANSAFSADKRLQNEKHHLSRMTRSHLPTRSRTVKKHTTNPFKKPEKSAPEIAAKQQQRIFQTLRIHKIPAMLTYAQKPVVNVLHHLIKLRRVGNQLRPLRRRKRGASSVTVGTGNKTVAPRTRNTGLHSSGTDGCIIGLFL